MSTPATVVDISVELQKAAAWELNPPDWREQAREIARAHGTTVLELLQRRVESTREIADLTKQLRHFSRLIQERIDRPRAEWLNAREAAVMLNITKASLYQDMLRWPDGPIARAASRVGRRLRFSKAGLDELLRSGLRPAKRSALLAGRASSPATKGGSR